MTTYDKLIEAIKEKNVDKVRDILKSIDHFELEKVDVKGNTVLMTSILRSTEEISRILIEHKDIYINKYNHSGNTALILAIQEKYEDLSKSLIEKMTDDSINKQNISGYTAFMEAVKKGLNTTCNLLLEKKPDFSIQSKNGDTAAMLAVQNTGLEEELLTKIIELTPETVINLLNSNNQTALIIASDYGTTEEVYKELIKKTSEVDHADNSGQTALHYIAHHDQVTSILLFGKMSEKGILKIDNNGNTALHNAVMSNTNPLMVAQYIKMNLGSIAIDKNLVFKDSLIEGILCDDYDTAVHNEQTPTQEYTLLNSDPESSSSSCITSETLLGEARSVESSFEH